MLTKHYFDKDGNFVGSSSVGGLPVPDGGSVVKSHIINYPWPIKLIEGVIVQDTDQEPFQGKWRKTSDVKKLKPAELKSPEEAKTQLYSQIKTELMSGQSAMKVDAAGISYPNLSKAVLSVMSSYEGDDVAEAVTLVLKELEVPSE